MNQDPSFRRALSNPDFRRMFLGQCVSLPGSMMQNTALIWHVSLLADEGEKALALGLVGLVRLVPIFLFSLVGGVVADSLDRRRILIVTQSTMALVAAALAAMTLSGGATLGGLYVLIAINSAVCAFDGPARSSLVPMLVPREHVSNAVSLNTTLFQLASIVGPALAGAALIWMPIGWVYALNAASFAGILAGLASMRPLPPRPASERPRISVRSGLEGLRFVFSTPLIRSATLLDFNAAVFSSASALLPIVAQDVLECGPVGFGWLCAAPSIGAVLASAYMVRNEHRIQRRGRVLLCAVAAYGASTVCFGLATTFPAAMVCLAMSGASDTVNMVLRNVLRQLHTPDHLRGRMTAVNVIFAKGGPELGELEAGAVAHAFGAPLSIVTGGLASLVTTGWIAWRSPELREYGTLRLLHPVTPSASRPEPVPFVAAAAPRRAVGAMR
jgi:MFS family permease